MYLVLTPSNPRRRWSRAPRPCASTCARASVYESLSRACAVSAVMRSLGYTRAPSPSSPVPPPPPPTSTGSPRVRVEGLGGTPGTSRTRRRRRRRGADFRVAVELGGDVPPRHPFFSAVLMRVRRAMGFARPSYSSLLPMAASTALERRSSPAQSGFALSLTASEEEAEARGEPRVARARRVPTRGRRVATFACEVGERRGRERLS